MARDRATIMIPTPRRPIPELNPKKVPVYRARTGQWYTADYRRVPAPIMERVIVWDDVVLAVVTHYGISAEDFFSERRHPDVVKARRAYVWLCRRLTRYSYPEIALYANRPTHSTVIAQHRIAAAAYASDAAYRAELDGIESRLKTSPMPDRSAV